MTRTEKLLAELIALPSVNPAFAPPSVTSARQTRLTSNSGKRMSRIFWRALRPKPGWRWNSKRSCLLQPKGGARLPASRPLRTTTTAREDARPTKVKKRIAVPISSCGCCRQTESARPFCSRRTWTRSAPTNRNSFHVGRTAGCTDAARATRKVPSPPCSPRFANWRTPNHVRLKRKLFSPV